MRTLLFIVFISTLIISCKKEGNSDVPNPVSPKDTLTAGWSVLTAGLPTENISDIFFTDNLNGFATGATGIYKSVNGGVFWSKKKELFNPVNIAAANSNRACFINLSDTVYVTQDGGASFQTTRYFTPGANVSFEDGFFSSLNTCYLTSKKYIWKSVNGGITYDTIYNFPIPQGYNSLFFLNDATGWVFKSDGIYKTGDGGLSWNLSKAFNMATGAVEFTDLNTGFAVASENNSVSVFKTTNGGSTWQVIYQPLLFTNNLSDIDFLSSSVGYFSMENRIYKTTDGGSTWNVVVALVNRNFVEIHFNDLNHGWASANDGTIVKLN